MSGRWTTWLAWLCWAVTSVLVIGNVPLLIAVDTWRFQTFPATERPLAAALSNDAAQQLALFAFATVGVLAIARHSSSRMGWLSLAVGFAGIAEVFSGSYAVFALLVAPDVWVGGLVAGWFQNWLWIASMGLLAVFVPLLFPDGRPLSDRWRRVAWLAAVMIAVYSFVLAIYPGPLTNSFMGLPEIANPLGLASPIFFEVAPGGALIDIVLFGALLALVLVAVASSILRLRRATGDERQQMKWFVWCLSAFATIFVARAVARQIGGDSSPLVGILGVGLMLAGIGIPVALGLAIFKYHLYDIDVLINRTLVYGVLTALLGLVYWAAVVVFQQLLSPLTQGSDLAIVGSTLAVAALFQPARRRTQAGVDRRFYRRRYDAQQTLEAFSGHLRQEVQLDSLRHELVAVVQHTMQPAHVSLWLRPTSVTQESSRSAARDESRNDLGTVAG